MVNSRLAPREFRGSKIFAVDGSVRGLRECIEKHGRVSCTTDEIVSLFNTPWSDQQNSKTFLPPAKLCTFTQGERDDSQTKTGPLHLRSYAFQFRGVGQLEPIEYLLIPSPQAFFKRITFRISGSENDAVDDYPCDIAAGFLQGLHDFMFAGPYQRTSYNHCDTVALGMVRGVRKAIKGWLAERKEEGLSINKWFRIKLNFFASDLLRDANARFRMAMFCEAQNKHRLGFNPDRATFNPWEIMSALHSCFRSLELLCGYLRYLETPEAKTNLHPDKGRDSKLDMAVKNSSDPILVPFKQDDSLKRHVMNKAKTSTGPFKVSEVRTEIKDRAPWRNMPDLGAKVTEAADELHKKGLLQHIDKSKARGRHTPTYEKAAWQDVLRDPSSKQEAERLELSRDYFN